MSFVFPASPALGTTYNPPGSSDYFVWNGTVWLQAVEAKTADYENIIVNSGMQESQQNGNNAGNNGFYPADQWFLFHAGGGVSATQRLATATPKGSLNRLAVVATTVDATLDSGDFTCLMQKVEGTRMAKLGWPSLISSIPAVASFGVRSSVAQTYTMAIRDSAGGAAFLFDFTSPVGVDTYYSVPIQIPGSGTWRQNYAFSLEFGITLRSGSTIGGNNTWSFGGALRTAQTGNAFMTTLNAEFHLFDVGLYADPFGTGLPPPWEMPEQPEEHMLCQRYWQQFRGLFSQNLAASLAYRYYSHATVRPRTTPAVGGTNIGNNGFPATPGSMVYQGGTDTVYETRTSSAAVTAGFYNTTITMDARM